MPKIDSEAVLDVVAKWTRFRNDFKGRSGDPKAGEVREFVTRGNATSSQLANALEFPNDPEVWESLGEIAFNMAARLRMPKVME